MRTAIRWSFNSPLWSRKKWAEINKLFFEQDEMLQYASAYDEKIFRKIKDVYEQVLKSITQMIINEDNPKSDGDLSDLFKFACDMMIEAGMQEEEKRAAKINKIVEESTMKANGVSMIKSTASRKRKEVNRKVIYNSLNPVFLKEHLFKARL